ncbi:MAG: chemotaxis protein CheW [Clostridium sp.]|jgi:purine-binding chemotaxis protein CheW|nr:chemotaxis protein CheW [Clostridium sp.]
MSEQVMNQNENETRQVQEESSSVERCLTFESAGLVLFLSTNYVIEIINGYPITYLPLLPPYIKGIINLRGQILPVVDIRICMGQSDMADSSGDTSGQSCIIVIDVDSLPMGIIVDSVRQVMDIDLQDVRPIPVKRQQKLLDGMVTLNDGSVLMSFDCHALAECRY